LHDVEQILRQLGIDPQRTAEAKPALIEVWNKIDRLDPEARARLENLASRQPAAEWPVLVSAISGEGIGALGEAIETRLAAGRVLIELTLDAADGAGVSWLHRHTEVIRKAVNEQSGRVAMTVRTDPGRANAVRERFSSSAPRIAK
jgi:GTPase